MNPQNLHTSSQKLARTHADRCWRPPALPHHHPPGPPRPPHTVPHPHTPWILGASPALRIPLKKINSWLAKTPSRLVIRRGLSVARVALTLLFFWPRPAPGRPWAARSGNLHTAAQLPLLRLVAPCYRLPNPRSDQWHDITPRSPRIHQVP